VDMGQKTGLADGQGLVQGLLANDFNGDGDLDLFLGREGAAGRMFQNQPLTGGDAPAQQWIGFTLQAAGDNTALGATIKLTDTFSQPLGMQMVDVGSGRGSQQPRSMIFGLGDLNETVDVTVEWPSGRVMEFSVAPAQFGAMMDLVEPETFSIDTNSVTFQAAVRPYTGNLDWIFVWETDHWTEAGLDIVEVTKTRGANCGFTSVTLQDGVTVGVSTKLFYQVDPVTGASSYRHELRWVNQPCNPGCYYKFGLESGLGGTTDSVPSTSTPPISFKVCPSSI